MFRLRENKKTIKYLLISIVLLTFVQILLGAAVRLTQSGLSCPDWPLCYGMVFPTFSNFTELNVDNFTYFQVMLEWIHRFNAAFLIGPLILMVFFIINFNKKQNNDLFKLSYILLFLLLVQGLLGGLTVFQFNSPWSVAIHLSFAFILFGFLLFMLKKVITRKDIDSIFFVVPKGKKKYIFISVVITLITSVAGAFTSKYGASLACSSWPLCNKGSFLISDSFELIHYSHRILGVLLFSSLVLMLIKIYPYIKNIRNKIKNILLLILLVFFCQVFIGAMLIVYSVPVWMGIFHQSIGLTLFGLLVTLLVNTKVTHAN